MALPSVTQAHSFNLLVFLIVFDTMACQLIFILVLFSQSSSAMIRKEIIPKNKQSVELRQGH